MVRKAAAAKSPPRAPSCCIIGTGPGIGHAVALAFAQEGYDLALLARHPQRLAETCAEIRTKTGREARAYGADAGDDFSAFAGGDFVGDDVRLIGVEAAGKGLDGAEHGATLLRGRPGILHGAETYVLQDDDGQIADSWSVSAGLDYPGVGPEHAHLKESGRAEYVGATDTDALAAFKALAEGEGILCAFESAHALAHAVKLAQQQPDAVLLVGLSGRGDKDVAQAQQLLGPSA